MPMVWYVPPLSPVVDAISRDGHDGEDPGNLFGAIDALRIPIEYLAGLFCSPRIRPMSLKNSMSVRSRFSPAHRTAC